MNGQILWSPGVKLEDIERQVILKAYSHFAKNKTATAIALGISIRTLDSRLEAYEVDDKTLRVKSEKRNAEREYQLARARGQQPAPYNGETLGHESHAGMGVESLANAPTQPTVPVPERAKIQDVLPKKAAQGGHNPRR